MASLSGRKADGIIDGLMMEENPRLGNGICRPRLETGENGIAHFLSK